MKCNIGKTDRIIRIIAGVVILIIGLVTKSWWGLIGLIPLLTAVLKWCPLYIPLKINTMEKKVE